MKNGALTVHPLKDIAICVFFGTANGVQMRYMASVYNPSTDSFTRVLGNSQGCDYANNASFVNSYITNDGYATYTYGTSSSAYETTIFRINNDNTVSLVTKLSANTMRWYTNNGTYITNTGLYTTSGTKIKNITLEGLSGASRVQLLDNLFIYSNRTNGSATSSTIKMADTNNGDLVALNMMLQEKHPIFYVKDTNVIISNPSNTLVNLYRTSDKVVTAITYRSNNYYSGLKNTATAGDLLLGKTAVSKGLEIVGSMPNNGALTYTPSSSIQTIPAGYTSGGTISAVDITKLSDYVTCLGLSEQIIGEVPYTKLEYIESSGTQWINTGVLPTNNTKVDLDFSFTSNTVSNKTCVFGSRETWQSKGFYFGVASDTMGRGWWGQYGSANTGELSARSDTNRHILSFSKNVYLDGVLVKTFTDNLTTPYANIALFGSFEGSVTTASASSQRIYGCKIYENNVLIKDFIPVKDPNNVVCLYDKVSNDYFYNSGSGTFIAGAEKPTYTKLEYIESSGTQYIDTGITSANNIEFELSMMATSCTAEYCMPIGGGDSCTPSNAIGAMWCRQYNSNNKQGQFNNQYPSTSFSSDYMNVDTILTFKNYTYTWKTNSNEDSISVTSGSTFTGSNIKMFTGSSSNEAVLPMQGMKLYYCKIWKSNVLVRDFIPVKDPNNVVCLYDKVSGEYFYNAGTGTFIAGGEV